MRCMRGSRSGATQPRSGAATPRAVALSRPIQRREQLLQVHQLRRVVVDDVRMRRVQAQVILVVGLGRIERLQRLDLRDDRRREAPCAAVSCAM